MKKRMALGIVAALLAAVASFWTAAQAAPKECKGSPNAAACDLDGDGIANKDDDDVDGDGIANADDPCPRDATNTCEDDGGGEDPGSGLPDPTTLIPTVDPGAVPDPTTLVPPTTAPPVEVPPLPPV